MTLVALVKQIEAATDAMSKAYGSTVFDEYAIVRLFKNRPWLEWYSGPRREDFIKNFHQDTMHLRTAARENRTGQYQVGEFDFAHEGTGTQSEAFLLVAENVFLICTNTRLSMAEIAKDPRWLKAQHAFADLAERVHLSPLELPATPAGPQL
jgi:hypothetical protein